MRLVAPDGVIRRFDAAKTFPSRAESHAATLGVNNACYVSFADYCLAGHQPDGPRWSRTQKLRQPRRQHEPPLDHSQAGGCINITKYQKFPAAFGHSAPYKPLLFSVR